MAEPEAQQRPGPSRKLATGCGLGCLLVLVVGVTLMWLSYRRAVGIWQTAEGFVREALTGDPATAYERLHEAKRQALSPAEFEAHWQTLRDQVGAVQDIHYLPASRVDLERAVVSTPVLVQGEKAALQVEVDVSPNDRPPALVDYRVTAAPAPGP